VSEYGKSKLAGELEVRNHCRAEYVILRPPAVYGPRDTEFLRLFKAVKQHLLPRPSGAQALSMVFVQDLAEAAVNSLTASLAGKAYFVAHREVVTARAMAEEIAAGQGLLWQIPQVRGVLSHPAAGRFFAPLSAQKERVVLLVTLLVILGAVLTANSLRSAREREAYRRANESAIHVANAAACREQGRYREEAAEYEKAVALREDDAVVWFHLGMVRTRLGDFAGARTALESAARLNPGMGAAHRRLALLAAGEGRLDEALLAIDRIRNSDPDYGAVQLLRARVLEASGDFEGARKAYIRFAHLVPDEKARARLGKELPSAGALRRRTP